MWIFFPRDASRLFFFFSSRRRHTRFDCDWSSDVCSSDLLADLQHLILIKDHAQRLRKTVAQQGMIDRWLIGTARRVRAALLFAPPHVRVQIGRASCRERG